MTKSRGILPPRRRWTPEEIAIVRADYAAQPAAAIAVRVGRTTITVYSLAKKLGLKKSPEFLASAASGRLVPNDARGLESRFKKGMTPANFGTRRPGWKVGRMGETMFKGGQTPHNWHPIGYECWKLGYLWRKIADERGVVWTQNWRQVHLLLWEEHHGPIPASHAIAFRDGNSKNITIDNLVCISHADWMRIHTIQNLPPELCEVIRLNGRIKREIRKLTEQQDSHEKQD